MWIETNQKFVQVADNDWFSYQQETIRGEYVIAVFGEGTPELCDGCPASP